MVETSLNSAPMEVTKVIRLLSLTIGVCLLVPSSSFLDNSIFRKVDRVLLISIDGLHEKDLDRFARENPSSTLAYLRHHGVTYSSASTSRPSDSFPGMLALATGGTPSSTGVYYDDSYDRKL